MIANNILFDRNDGKPHDDSQQSIQLRKLREVMISNVDEVKYRVINKFFDIFSIQADTNNFNGESIIDNSDVIDDDMFDIGEIHDNILIIDIPPMTIKINLLDAIQSAIIKKAPSLIHLLLKRNINLADIEPNIMTMCVETDQYDLLLNLVEKKINIDTENYKCVYYLAAEGELDILKIIIETYEISDITELVSKICIQAILNDHCHILQYFLTPEAFETAPDIMFTFFLKSIEHGTCIEIIDFFIKNGINIKQQNYSSLHKAINFNKQYIIEYFYKIDNTIINLLSDDQKIIFNIGNMELVPRYIGTEAFCYISYDDIYIDCTFYCCSNKHCFKESVWRNWIKNKFDNLKNVCPKCLAPIDKNLYINTKK
jgi:hypothetical protein